MIAALRSSNPEYDKDALSDLIAARVLDQISRTPGVGSTQLFGGEYAMNIWLNPDKLRGYGLSASQVLAAVRGQRSEEHTSELQSLMRISYAVFCLKKKT